MKMEKVVTRRDYWFEMAKPVLTHGIGQNARLCKDALTGLTVKQPNPSPQSLHGQVQSCAEQASVTATLWRWSHAPTIPPRVLCGPKSVLGSARLGFG